MGEVTGIAWCDHTLNAWIGCHKVSDGCRSCYAEHSPPVRVMRSRGLEVWGAHAERHETKGWRANIRQWNAAAIRAGERRRVFCHSLSDVFEDHPVANRIRPDLCAEIERATGLDFLLLTKRPENMTRLAPKMWEHAWPINVVAMTTVESQAMANERIPHLLRVPAMRRGLSMEPLLEAVDLSEWLTTAGCPGDALPPEQLISWIIIGGESGSSRPFDLAWARSLLAQADAAGVPAFLKQFGAHPVDGTYAPRADRPDILVTKTIRLVDSHGGDEAEWPEDLRGRRAFYAPVAT